MSNIYLGNQKLTRDYGLEDMYDAIVDASGNGDYTLIGDAIDAGKRRIFVKNGTYNETEGHVVNFEANDGLMIYGESRTGVVVNTTITTAEHSPWSNRKLPAFLYITIPSNGDYSIEFKTMTINLDINLLEGLASCSFVEYGSPDGGRGDIYIDDIDFTFQNAGQYRAYCNLLRDLGGGSGAIQRGITDIYNCKLIYRAINALCGCDSVDGNNDQVVFKNCLFWYEAQNNNGVDFTLNNLFDCQVYGSAVNLRTFRLNISNAHDSYIYCPRSSNITGYINFSDSVNCEFRGGINHATPRPDSATIIKEWTPNTSYTTSDYVFHGGALYRCNTNHTSSSGRFDDEDYRTDIIFVSFSNLTNCSVNCRTDCEVRGINIGTRFGDTYTSAIGRIYMGPVSKIIGCVINGDWIYMQRNSILSNNTFGSYDLWMLPTIHYNKGSNIISENIASHFTLSEKNYGTKTNVVKDNIEASEAI